MHSCPQTHLFPGWFAEKAPGVAAHAESDAANRHMMPIHMAADGIELQFDHAAQGIHFSSDNQAAASERRPDIRFTRFKVHEAIKNSPKLPMAQKPLVADLLQNSTDGCRGQAPLQVAKQRRLFIIEFIR